MTTSTTRRRRAARATKPTATAIYARLSYDRYKDAAKTARQVADCRALGALKELDIREEFIFIDDDKSATNGKVRPDFERLIAAIEAGKIGAVLVWHMDRLVRLMPDLMRIITAGQDMGFAIISVNGQSLDMSDPTGIAVAQILTAIAGMEAGHKAERQIRATDARHEAGSWSKNKRAYGYDDSGEIIEAEAVFVREAFRRFNGGMPIRALTRWLNSEGSVNTRGLIWQRYAVRHMLVNPRYIAQVAVSDGPHRFTVVNEHGQWEPIVDRDTFRLTQNIVTDAARLTKKDNTRQWLGAGFYRCGICGGNLHTHYIGSGTKLDANGKRLNARGYACKTLHMTRGKADEIDLMVTEAVLERLRTMNLAEELADDHEVTRANVLRARRSELMALSDSLPAELDGVSPEETPFVMKLLRRKEAEIQAEIAEIDDEIDDLNAESALALLTGADDPGAEWENFDVVSKQKVAGELVTVTLLPIRSGPQRRLDKSTVVIELVQRKAAG